MVKQIREQRMTDEEKDEYKQRLLLLQEAKSEQKNTRLKELGCWISRIDSYSPMRYDNEIVDCDYRVFEAVWNEAKKWRKNRKLLKYGEQIQCPVVAIHGEQDPHPCEGVFFPLQQVLGQFQFHLLKNCGHHPWYEKEAHEVFYKRLNEELFS